MMRDSDAVPESPAYARLQKAAHEATEAANLHAMHSMKRVYQLCRTYGTDVMIPAAEVLDALGLDENANTMVPSAVDRAALSAKLWAVAEQHIVAEWICCEPLEPRHDLCAKGYAALGMAKTLLVDADPAEAWNPNAPLLDAVLAVLPATTDRATVLSPIERRMLEYALNLADAEIEHDDHGISDDEQDALAELRRMAAETPQPETVPLVGSAAIRRKLRRWAYAAGHIEAELDGAVDRVYTLIAQDIIRGPAAEQPAAPAQLSKEA
jgi:hypothetical protein